MSEATDRPDRARGCVRCLVIPHICPDIGTFNHKSHFTEHILFYTLATGCFILRIIQCQTKQQVNVFLLA